MGFLSAAIKTGSKLGGRTVGSSTGRAATAGAGAGLLGGTLVDDIPLVGDDLDPTEGSEASPAGSLFGGDIQMLIVLAVVLVIVLEVTGD